MGNYSRPSTPVVGGGTAQVYAMQVRLALNERFQLFADKDGLVMLNPKGSRSVFGMADINLGGKYVFIRDEESQFLFSGAAVRGPDRLCEHLRRPRERATRRLRHHRQGVLG